MEERAGVAMMLVSNPPLKQPLPLSSLSECLPLSQLGPFYLGCIAMETCVGMLMSLQVALMACDV